MIKVFCDMCKTQIKDDINTINIPRKTKYYANSCGKRVYEFDKIEMHETIVCDECYNKLANLFIAIGDE